MTTTTIITVIILTTIVVLGIIWGGCVVMNYKTVKEGDGWMIGYNTKEDWKNGWWKVW